MGGINYIGHGNDDGTSLGKDATSKISFFGSTPVVQQTTTIAADTASAVTTGGTTLWGYASQSQADTIALAVLGLENLGLTAA